MKNEKMDNTKTHFFCYSINYWTTFYLKYKLLEDKTIRFILNTSNPYNKR